MCAQIKKILLYCKDLCMLHKMAARVGLPDVTKEIVKSNPMTEAYLKDMGLTTWLLFEKLTTSFGATRQGSVKTK